MSTKFILLEAFDTMLKYSDLKKFSFKNRNLEREEEIYNFIMEPENMKKLSDKMVGKGNSDFLVGGGHVAKYDIIAYVNGDKRNNVKKRIVDIIYLMRILLQEEMELIINKLILLRKILRIG